MAFATDTPPFWTRFQRFCTDKHPGRAEKPSWHSAPPAAASAKGTPLITVAEPTTDALRDALIQLIKQGKTYESLAVAERLLAAEPQDGYVRLMAVRCLVELGLVQPAKEMLAGASAWEADADVEPVRQSLARLRGAPVSWRTLADRFERNVASMEGRGSLAAELRSEWSRAESCYELYRDRHGEHQIRERSFGGDWRWIPILARHGQVENDRAWPEDIGANMPGPYLFEGLGLGGYFERLYHRTHDTFLGYSSALYVVERKPARLAMVLHLRDWRGILADPRVHFFLGENALDALRSAWEQDADLPPPRQAFTSGPFDAHDPPQACAMVERFMAARDRKIEESLADLERRYAGRDRRWWARRLGAALRGEDRPLRILSAVSIHTTFLQHSIRDAKRAIESLGHECRVLTEQTPYAMTGSLTFHNAIRELEPDIFFLLDHLRPEVRGLIPEGLPLLTWDQDQLPHVVTRANLANVLPHDFLVGCSKSRCVELGFNPKQYLHARVPTCPEQFGGDPLTDEELQRYACDVSFVSHASQTPHQFHLQQRESCDNPAIARLIDQIYEIIPEYLAASPVPDGHVMSAIIDDASRRCGVTGLDDDACVGLGNWYVWRLADRIFRHQALDWIADWSRATSRIFRIYGNGWREHPTLAPFAAGPAANGRELLCIHRASKINLQLMPAGFIHQRALDGLAGGGFFLSRLAPGDLRGKSLRRLITRIDELGISTTNELIHCQDDEVRSLLREQLGASLSRSSRYMPRLLDHLRYSAELLHPDEAFQDFEQIVFESADRFASLAETFLGDDETRRAVQTRMRQVVVERFSYRAAVDQFLRAMTDYLSSN